MYASQIFQTFTPCAIELMILFGVCFVTLPDVIPEVANDNVMADAPQRPDFRLVWSTSVSKLNYLIIALIVKLFRGT